MSRGGRIHRPLYTIVAADSRFPRDGRFIQKLGQYDPNAGENKELTALNTEAISGFIKNGAILSPTLKSLFKKYGVKLA